MRVELRVLCCVCAAIMLTCTCLTATAEEGAAPQAFIERMVSSFAACSERDTQAMEELTAAEPALADKWGRIMDLWEAPVLVNAELPDSLPGDDTLCLVALGFQLNPDGTMRDELIQRLKVLLAASEKYPRAVIVCTGGGTAADDPTATEAGKMAQWLCDQGLDPSRIYVEDKSITTAQNAILTFDILEEHCPQIAQIAIISSDYHIATGMLLFGAEAILRDSPITITGNAAWHAPSGALSAMFQAGALIELSGDVETAFEIYYETYDIHELPPLHNAADERTEKNQKDVGSVSQETAQPAPVTLVGRPEESAFSPVCAYILSGIQNVDGRQGVAWSDGYYYISGSTTLSKYDAGWNLIAGADNPFAGFADEVNHIGDIDVYKGEIYAGVEHFMDGEAKNIQIAVYDAESLTLKRTYPFSSQSGQTEVSGIAVDPDSGSIWLCSWADGESGRYIYRYDLGTGEYLGKYHLQPPPQWIQGIAYRDGQLYITADDGTADLGEPDHVYRVKVNLSRTAWTVILERTLDDVVLQGEIEGISFTEDRMLISYNRGARIVLGMPKGFYEGYDSEIHEVFEYKITQLTGKTGQ